MLITSDENKELLSQILVNHPLKQNPESFNKFLDAQLKTIHQSRFKYKNNLTAMNKEVLRIFQTIVPPRSSLQKVPIQKQRTWTSGGDSETESVPKIKIFESRLKEQKDHFNSMIKAEIPEEIDFSDKADSGDNVSLDDTMLQRQAELEKIMSNYQKKNAESWIKGDNVKPDNIKISPSSVLKKDSKPSMAKRVSFQINEKNDTDSSEIDTQSLFNKLKIKTDDSTDKEEIKSGETNFKTQIDYTQFFKTMISNQEQIIKLLQLKQEEH